MVDILLSENGNNLSLFNRVIMLNLYKANDELKTLLEEKDIEFTDEYLKLPNGFMMVFMAVKLNAGVESGTFDFPIAFKQVYDIYAFHNWATESYGYASVGRSTLTSVDVLIKDLSNGFSKERNGSVIAIGRYK